MIKTKQKMNKKELVVIKYGGGLITFKDQLCEANYEHINGLSEVVKRLLDTRHYHIIIVHGAGGFGHLKAKQWKLHMGKLHDMVHIIYLHFPTLYH